MNIGKSWLIGPYREWRKTMVDEFLYLNRKRLNEIGLENIGKAYRWWEFKRIKAKQKYRRLRKAIYKDNPGACLEFPFCKELCDACDIEKFNEYEQQLYTMQRLEWLGGIDG